jgi:peptidoglycan hydrolase CwlO-like protein
MRPILGQTHYDELKTDFDVIAQTYKALEPKRGTLEKAKEIAALQSSVDELQSEVEVLSSVVEEACEENFQLKARVKELEKQAQEGKSRRSAA